MVTVVLFDCEFYVFYLFKLYMSKYIFFFLYKVYELGW